MSEVAFRAMAPADLEAVADLTHRADPFGWTLRNFSDAHASGNTLTVLTVDGVTSGIAAVMHVLDESELLEIAVQPAMQGRGHCAGSPQRRRAYVSRSSGEQRACA